jgi:opacity protein-like surface antigen
MQLQALVSRSALAFFFAAFICASAQAQTNLAVSIYGAFSSPTTGNAVREVPADSAGGMIELRHIVNPLVGFEANYSLNRANQVYESPGFCGLCGAPIAVSANAHEITGDWVFSSRSGKLRPFAFVGAGVMHFQPVQSTQGNTSAPTQSSTTPVYVYGVGLDWKVLPHLGLRLQCRGNLYNAPDLTLIYGYGPGPGTNNGTVFTHTVEPGIGLWYKF